MGSSPSEISTTTGHGTTSEEEAEELTDLQFNPKSPPKGSPGEFSPRAQPSNLNFTPKSPSRDSQGSLFPYDELSVARP